MRTETTIPARLAVLPRLRSNWFEARTSVSPHAAMATSAAWLKIWTKLPQVRKYGAVIENTAKSNARTMSAPYLPMKSATD